MRKSALIFFLTIAALVLSAAAAVRNGTAVFTLHNHSGYTFREVWIIPGEEGASGGGKLNIKPLESGYKVKITIRNASQHENWNIRAYYENSGREWTNIPVLGIKDFWVDGSLMARWQ